MRETVIYRPGAFGDALMASSVFPALQASGRQLVFLTSERGEEVCRHDPHLARLMVMPEALRKASLPVALTELFGTSEVELIVLAGSVEWRLLPRAEDPEFFWPDVQRRRMFSGSYLAHVHQLAGVPPPYRVKFYPSQEETSWVTARVEKIGRPFVFWALRGSHMHKWYPHVGKTLCQVLARTEAAIVLSGAPDALPMETQILKEIEGYHGDLSRVFSLVGIGTLRQACALAQRASVVVGPETGVMNAVSLEPMRKVCLLSHSSPSNLTDDWTHTTAIEPRQAECYPCHRLHRDFTYCPQDTETGAARCAASVHPGKMASAILAGLQGMN